MMLSPADGGGARWRLGVADTWFARLRGLIGRRELAPDEGLYLPGTNGVHMLFMRFPIDCIFLGQPLSDGRRPVVAIRQRLQPWRGVVWYVRGAKAAVEVRAGSVAAAGLQPGDLVGLSGPVPVS